MMFPTDIPSSPTSSDRPSAFPDWLEAYRMDDARLVEAYEHTSSALRARLKTAIALQCALEKERPVLEECRRISRVSGFEYRVAQCPADWVLVVLDPLHNSPARLVAAVLPAILAGVKYIHVAGVGASPSAKACVALELAGVEEIFVMPDNSPVLQNLLLALHQWKPDGRLLLFPTVESRLSAEFVTLRQTARKLGLRLWQDRPKPRLLLTTVADKERQGSVGWAHGAAELEYTENPTSLPLGMDAAYLSTATNLSFPQLFGPGLEACWFHPRLDVRFFQNVTLAATFC